MNFTSQNQPASSPAVSLSARETILVVDDHPDLCQVAEILLRRCGYRVLSATNGEQAKKIARENANIGLLLTDVEMPGLPGDELAAWFRMTSPGTPIVFMSGNPMQFRRLQPCYFVEKPFIHLDTLVKTIGEALHHRRSTQQTVSAAA